MEKLKVYNDLFSNVDIESSGKIVVLLLWSLDCKYCKKQLKIINEIVNQYEEGVSFYIVCSLKDKEESGSVLKYYSDEKFNFKLYFDINYSLAKTYKTVAYPTTVFLDKDLNTLSKIVGLSSKEEIIDKIEEYK